MAKPTYKLVTPVGELPYIDHANGDGLSWQKVKAELRSWYLQQAASLRTFTEKDYWELEEDADVVFERQADELDNAAV